jgi:chemotaxis protein methyltransferase CheR
MREDYPFKGKFQIIFCRNVMIYFDTPTRNALVQRFHRFLEPGGYLFIGHSESLGRMNCPFRYVKPAIYRKEGE